MSGRLHAHRGFTLVELLVALVIGLLLTVLVSQVFVSSKRAYATTDDLSRMQENMRFAHDILGRTVRMASYMSAPGNMQVSFDSYPGQFDGANSAVSGTDGTGNNPDSITLKYQGTADGATVDCFGNVIAENAFATNVFTIETVNGVPSLVCKTGTGAGAPTAVMTGDVDNMQILYGEETNGDFNADRYVPAASVSDMNRVVSIRMALLFRTASQNLRPLGNPDTTEYDLLGKKLPAFTGAEATRNRRVMTVTFALRNRSP
jgi:type IV pilus assembly protein PilW